MSTDKKFEFLITPEPRDPLVSVSQGNFVDITFTVQNVSGRRVRVEALINALQGPAGADGIPLPAFAWQQRLQILKSRNGFLVKTMCARSACVSPCRNTWRAAPTASSWC